MYLDLRGWGWLTALPILDIERKFWKHSLKIAIFCLLIFYFHTVILLASVCLQTIEIEWAVSIGKERKAWFCLSWNRERRPLDDVAPLDAQSDGNDFWKKKAIAGLNERRAFLARDTTQNPSRRKKCLHHDQNDDNGRLGASWWKTRRMFHNQPTGRLVYYYDDVLVVLVAVDGILYCHTITQRMEAKEVVAGLLKQSWSDRWMMMNRELFSRRPVLPCRSFWKLENVPTVP